MFVYEYTVMNRQSFDVMNILEMAISVKRKKYLLRRAMCPSWGPKETFEKLN